MGMRGMGFILPYFKTVHFAFCEIALVLTFLYNKCLLDPLFFFSRMLSLSVINSQARPEKISVQNGRARPQKISDQNSPAHLRSLAQDLQHCYRNS